MSYLYILISGLILMGLWAVANIVLWLVNVKKVPRGSTTYYQWQVNGFINTAYLFIVLASAVIVSQHAKQLETDFDMRMLTALTVMAGIVLSSAMVAIGYSMKKDKKHRKTSWQIGGGNSLMYQGVCLLIFLAIMSQFLVWTA